MLVACICFVRTRLFYFVPLDNLHRRCLLLRCGSESYTMLRMVTDAHAPVIHILYAPRGKPRKTIFRKSVVLRLEVHDKTAKKKKKGLNHKENEKITIMSGVLQRAHKAVK